MARKARKNREAETSTPETEVDGVTAPIVPPYEPEPKTLDELEAAGLGPSEEDAADLDEALQAPAEPAQAPPGPRVEGRAWAQRLTLTQRAGFLAWLGTGAEARETAAHWQSLLDQFTQLPVE